MRWVEMLVVLGLTGLCLCGGFIAPIQAAFTLAFGWIWFLARVAPEIHFSGDSAALGVICLLLFSVGLHGFLSWIWSARGATSSGPGGESAKSTPAWKARWSLQLVVLALVLFVAGISMVGITHQLLWMARDPDPILSSDSEAASRMFSGNNLKQLAVGAEIYRNEQQSLPPGYAADRHGLPLHGWLTLLLPQLEQQKLFDTIDQSRAWDDPANRAAFSTTLPFATQGLRRSQPQTDAQGYALTHYAGSIDLLGSSRAWKQAEISDGTSQTILFGEAAGNFRPWGHPRNVRDARLGINQSPDGFGGPWTSGGCQFAFADGSVRYIHPSIDAKVLEALATPDAGDTVTDDSY